MIFEKNYLWEFHFWTPECEKKAICILLIKSIISTNNCLLCFQFVANNDAMMYKALHEIDQQIESLLHF